VRLWTAEDFSISSNQSRRQTACGFFVF